ncbi:hypothetical protein J6590_002816 [Homalodisca vitripennis]|nr:hypothetical protein J6590_002816 [Homalodisca vitripennis]
MIETMTSGAMKGSWKTYQDRCVRSINCPQTVGRGGGRSPVARRVPIGADVVRHTWAGTCLREREGAHGRVAGTCYSCVL